MDFVKLIAEMRPELSLAEIARTVGISRAYMSDLASGKSRAPSYRVGKALLDLHRSTVSSPPSLRRARA